MTTEPMLERLEKATADTYALGRHLAQHEHEDDGQSPNEQRHRWSARQGVVAQFDPEGGSKD